MRETSVKIYLIYKNNMQRKYNIKKTRCLNCVAQRKAETGTVMDVISSYYTSVSVSMSNVLYTKKQDSCVKEKID